MQKRVPWNKGLTKKDHPSIAKCGFQPGHKGYSPWKGKKIYPHMVEALQKANRGRSNYNKNLFTSTSYSAIHKWLNRNFGKAHCCESKFCDETSICFDYALLKGKKYDHKRENFVQLCRKCHLGYDQRNKKIS